MENQKDYIRLYRDTAGFVAGTTCRGGEATEDDTYSGFTLCHYTEDKHEHYNAHLLNFIDIFGISRDRIVVPRQTHSTNVLVIDSEEKILSTPENVDAVVTNQKGVMIGVNTADCVPVIIADETSGVIGVAHAGWRGAVGGIIANTAAAMRNLGADMSRVVAFVAPAICRDCFEVGEEVAEQFSAEFVSRSYGVKPHIDLKGYVADRLLAEGIDLERLHVDSACTRCQPMEYFSARALGIRSGRNYTFIASKLAVEGL